MIYPNDHNDAQFRIVVYGASIKKEEKRKNLLIVTAERIAERQPTVSSITFLLHHGRKGNSIERRAAQKIGKTFTSLFSHLNVMSICGKLLPTTLQHANNTYPILKPFLLLTNNHLNLGSPFFTPQRMSSNK